jgi:hypothetical protein
VFFRQSNGFLGLGQVRAGDYQLLAACIAGTGEDAGEVVGVSLRSMINAAIDWVCEIDADLLWRIVFLVMGCSG